MSDLFNPYSEWLGIPSGVCPPDHYTLLGVASGEADPKAIAQAADSRMTSIRKIRPGKHAAEWASLLDEIREAKACLLDPGRRADYDLAVAEGRASPASTIAGSDSPTGPAPAEEADEPRHALGTMSPSSGGRLAVPTQRPSQLGSTLAGFLAGIVLVAAGYVAWEKRAEIAALCGVEETVRRWGLAEDADPGAQPLRDEDSLATNQGVPQESRPTPPEDDRLWRSPRPAEPAGRSPKPESNPRPSPRIPSAGRHGDNRSHEFADLLQQASTEPAKIDPERQQAFRRELTAARKAMATRDLPGANRHLQQARENVQTDAEVAEFRRVEALLHYIHEFWKGIRDSLANLPGGLVLELENDQKAAVVEAGPDRLILHAGQSFHWGLNDIPSHVLLAIAKKGFQQDATTKVIVGAFLVVDHRGHRERGRAMWEQAARDGADVAELMPELEVDYGFASETGDGPTSNQPPSATLPGAPAVSAPHQPLRSLASLREAARNARAFSEKRQVVAGALFAAQHAAKSKRLEEANELAELALQVARDTKNVALMRSAAAAMRQIEILRHQRP